MQSIVCPVYCMSSILYVQYIVCPVYCMSSILYVQYIVCPVYCMSSILVALVLIYVSKISKETPFHTYGSFIKLKFRNCSHNVSALCSNKTQLF